MELAVYSRFNYVKDCYVLCAAVKISLTEFRGQKNIQSAEAATKRSFPYVNLGILNRQV